MSSRGDVCLLQVGAISLSPQVENPLCRRALREDLYSWAQEQGMLNAVGSDLEDRQYQLRFSAFFLCTCEEFAHTFPYLLYILTDACHFIFSLCVCKL